MLYTGTVLLGIPEDRFWRMTPRKLFALLRVHSGEGKPEQGNTTANLQKMAAW